jgi:hypothetical protein
VRIDVELQAQGAATCKHPRDVSTPRQQRIRDAALELLRERPGLGQREIADTLRAELGVGASGAVKAIRALEQSGEIVSRREERRKVYQPAAEPPEELARPEPPPVPRPFDLRPQPPAKPPLPLWTYGAAVLGAIVCNFLIVWLLVHA